MSDSTTDIYFLDTDRPEGQYAGRLLLSLLVGALCVSVVLVGSARTDSHLADRTYESFPFARADTDSVSISKDSLRVLLAADSLLADSLAPPDTGRASRYMPRLRRDDWSARIFPRAIRPFSTEFGQYWTYRIEYDTSRTTYTTHEEVGKSDIRIPRRLTYDDYKKARLDRDLDKNWREIVVQRAREVAQRRRGGLGFNIVVPGGRQSAFTSIFGKPSVDLSVNGQADITAGFDYRKSDQQVSITGSPTQLDPNFKQDLRLGIKGTIGDKLQIDVQYDSKNQFDYQNQLKLQYTGYEDEIIQKIEAGNVFLQTPSTLIRGGQSLFGIKSELKLGGVTLTTVASQQEGQSNSLNIEGGSEASEFDLKPTDYSDATHFFLSYYFRNRWEEAMSDPPTIRLANGFERITEFEIWRLEPTQPEELNVRQVVAMVDLGESERMLELASGYTDQLLPNDGLDQYDHNPGGEIDQELRRGSAAPGSYLESKGLGASDFQVGKFKRLERGRDYDVDEVLGYVTMRQRLQETEALAVAYRYRANGRTFQVGDFSTDTGGSDGGQNEDKLVLKLVRPVQLRQPAPESNFNPAAWYLEMRNIYRLPNRGIQPTDFELQIFYEPPGKTASKTLPGVGGTQTLLQLLKLDRVNEDQALQPDDLFDFLVNYSIVPGDGTLLFPVLEPFGQHLSTLIDAGGGTEDARQQLKDLYVYKALYLQKKANARRDSQHDVFQIRGSSKGTVKSFYNLNAFAGLVQGSVRVTSGGTPLQEGTDFIVDYTGATVNIINPAFLTSGREIAIDYEQNSLFTLQKKTLLGLRLDYSPSERIAFGATMMKMNQKSPIDKFRIGEEPISNTIWGVDGNVKLQPRWLTQAIDAIPLLQTREPSQIALTGEFAQLRPNTVQTIAFDRTRSDLKKQGRDFATDELKGTSYIDDFEGFENTFSLMQPGTWGLSAPPDSIGIVDRLGIRPGSEADSLRTNWRSSFAWYRINANMLREIPTVAFSGESIKIFRIDEVFPNRDASGELDPSLETFDLFFDPAARGPYNYTRDLRGFLDDPQETWGGMTQRLPEGFTDFSLKNIDFVEFVFRPFAENAEQDAGRSAKLYVDLGSISEDVVPDEKLNNEDGLSMATIGESSVLTWGRTPNATQNSVVDVDDATQRTEDLGLDGLASYGGDYPPFATEQDHFADFLNSLDAGSGDPKYRAEMAKALADPSGDDYHYFANEQFYGNAELFPNTATFQQHFTHYFAGHELNAFETQNKLANNTSIRRGNSRFPDSEDRNLNSTVDTENSYFQYELPLSKSALDSLAAPDMVDDFVVGEITDRDGRGTGWFQVRIPVQRFTRQVGTIQDFSLIESMRIWTTGHKVPITMRFATLELVGSQWQKAPQVASERENAFETAAEDTKLTISSINNEENADTYIPPAGAVVSQTRLANGGIQNAREQALVLRVENLKPGRQRAIFKTQNQGLDLLKYSNLRMFAHLSGKTMDGVDISSLPPEVARGKVKLFVRLGANQTNDYYEYEQPLSPSSETSGSSDELWQTNVPFNEVIQDLNSMNIELSALNKLKVARDRLAFPTDSVFVNVIADTLRTPDAPDAETFAPPGTRLSIRGTPSLGRVNSIVIGIRNAADSTSTAFEDVLEDVTVWVNELRVAGYDETNGWAALFNADIKLADVARIKTNIRTQTDGFGSLASSLGDREQNNIDNWSVTSEFNADKLIPERYNWKIPLSVQIQSNTTTPRFSPTRGDVRLEELLSQIDERTDLEPAEKEAAKLEATQSAQTHSFTRSITGRIGKSNSRSRILRNTIDGIGLTYSHSNSESRSPTQLQNDSWRWSSTLSYRFASRKTRTLSPFWFLRSIPLLGGTLGSLQFNYMPKSFTSSATFTRNFSETRERPILAPGDTSTVPLSVRFPAREKHTFSHSRNFAFQYSPFVFLNLGFDLNTSQSLNAAGVDTLFSVVTPDTLLAGVSLAQAQDQGLLSEEQLANAFEQSALQVRSANNVISDFLSERGIARAEKSDQRFTASFRPRLNRIKALNWIQLQDISYQAIFNWQNGPIGRNTGANIRNQVSFRAGMSVRVQEFWRKFGFYKSIEKKQKKYESDRDRERKVRDAEKKRRKAAREAEKQEERMRKEAEEALKKKEEENAEDGKKEETASEDVKDKDDSVTNDPEVSGEQDDVEDAPEKEVEPPKNPGINDARGIGAAKEEESSSGGGFRLPFPNFGSLARQLILAATGIRDFTLSYDGTRGASSTNVGTPILNDDGTVSDVETHFSLIDAFNGHGASPAYRFGLDRTFDITDRLIDPSLQVADILNNGNKFQGRTTLNPSKSLSINLNWNLDFQQDKNFTFRPALDLDQNIIGIDTTLTQSGTNKSSVWAFGASYIDLFQAQLATYTEDLAASPEDDPERLGDENRDGRVVLTNESVTDDFRSNFVGGGNTLDSRNLLPFPKPSWTVNYTGLSKWPIIRALVKNLTLKHGYNADYSADYSTNTQFGDNDSLRTLDLGSRQIEFPVREFQTGNVRINERYSPLIGMDITWKGQFQTNLSWSRSNSFSLSTSNFEVSENRTNEFSLNMTWQKTGLRLPLFGGKKLNNRISFSLTLARATTRDQRLRLRRALQSAISDPDFVTADALTGDNISLVTAHVRTTIQPRIAYQFSNRVSADFTLKYEKFDSEDSRQPSATMIQGNFNIRVSIAN